MPQQKVYRPTPANPTTHVDTPPVRDAAIEDLDDFLDEIDAILTEEESFAVLYRQRGGQ